MKSIIDGDDEFCFLCKKLGLQVRATDTHHMIFGTANRKFAEEDGLKCNLCHIHHMRLHQQGFYKKDLQQLAEKTWLEYYGKTIPDWISRYGKNFIDEDEL